MRCWRRFVRTARVGARGRNEWTPGPKVIDALEAGFYTAFENLESTRKRLLLALDASGSMTYGEVAGIPGITPRDASAALALVTAPRDYRRASNIDARLVVVGMVSNGFSIADRSDDGMLDIVGFDTATPQLIADVARGTL